MGQIKGTKRKNAFQFYYEIKLPIFNK